jgi:hypothetical protein
MPQSPKEKPAPSRPPCRLAGTDPVGLYSAMKINYIFLLFSVLTFMFVANLWGREVAADTRDNGNFSFDEHDTRHSFQLFITLDLRDGAFPLAEITIVNMEERAVAVKDEIDMIILQKDWENETWLEYGTNSLARYITLNSRETASTCVVCGQLLIDAISQGTKIFVPVKYKYPSQECVFQPYAQYLLQKRDPRINGVCPECRLVKLLCGSGFGGINDACHLADPPKSAKNP